MIEKIPYLKELGMNQIQCMPVYEFDECAKTKINYWGYGAGVLFCAEGAHMPDWIVLMRRRVERYGKSVPQCRNRGCSGNAVC